MKASTSETLIRETRALALTTPYQKRKKSKGRKFGQQTGAGVQTAAYTPWMSLMRGNRGGTVMSRLHHEIAAYESWLRLTEQEKTARRIIVECIETVVKENIASDAKVQLFGSSATQLCLPTSDIDIIVTTPQRWGEVFQTRVLAQLSCLVRDMKLAWSATEYPHPQVPILKFAAMQRFGAFNVDISITHGEGVSGNLKEVNAYLAKMPALRPLVLVLKTLVAQHGLNNQAACGIGSYAITCMCIYFINANPFQRPPAYFANPYASQSLGTLLSDFFWHFSNNFPFSTSVVSPIDGKLYPNPEPEVSLNTGMMTGVQKRMTVLCLAHPVNNVAQSVDQGTLEALISIFQKACHTILKSTVGDRTILGKIVTVDKNALKFRSKIRLMMDRESLDDEATGLKRKAKVKKNPAIEGDLTWQAQDQQDVARQYLTRFRANFPSNFGSSNHNYHFASNASHRSS
ncbi:hypothetical protein F5887DRAFT_962362 [Amanita rubescens]|nr:hypothetical protein F5887DRAFT_962362 [Amanita rubescens]